MKRKTKAIITFVIGAIIIAGTYVYRNVPLAIFGEEPFVAPEQLPGNTVLTAEQVAEDRNALIKYVEDIHPYFEISDDITAYNKAKEEFTKAASSEMTVTSFGVCASKFLNFFCDGHTRITWKDEYTLSLCRRFENGKLYAAKTTGPEGYVEITPDTRWITEIGGVDVERIFEVVDMLFPAENQIMANLHYATYSGYMNILRYAGADIQGNITTVLYSDGTEEAVEFNDIYRTATTSATDVPSPVNTYSYENGIFITDFNECNDDDELKGIAEALEKAVSEGCGKVIIDARGNGGGNSNACTRLLRAMGMEPPEYGSLIRFSDEAKEQRGYLRGSGSITIGRSVKSKQNGNVDLIVLSDGNTFSSATMLLVYVRDGKLGRIVGEPSSNKPNCYGDIIGFSLKNSHLYGYVSHKLFSRPDNKIDESMLIPDVVCMPENAMEEALGLLG